MQLLCPQYFLKIPNLDLCTTEEVHLQNDKDKIKDHIEIFYKAVQQCEQPSMKFMNARAQKLMDRNDEHLDIPCTIQTNV